jgi:hypothetical protein
VKKNRSDAVKLKRENGEPNFKTLNNTTKHGKNKLKEDDPKSHQAVTNQHRCQIEEFNQEINQ